MLLIYFAAEHGRYGFSFVWNVVEWAVSAEYCIHLVEVNRLTIWESFVVCIVGKNGTRCRNGVKVLWYHSYLVWLVFEGSIPTCTCFLWLVPAFLYCSRNGKREERWERRPRGRCMVCKVWKYIKCFRVKMYLEAQAKPKKPKCKPHEFYEAGL